MEELRAEIDGEPPPSVLDHPRVAVAADPGSRLEQVDVEAPGEEVRRGHAARAAADDRHAVVPRPRPYPERRQADRALERLPAGHRCRGHGQLQRYPRVSERSPVWVRAESRTAARLG
jgi:hypothetical protein